MIIWRAAMDSNLEFGVIGLGRMGGNLSLQAIEKGLRVVGYTRKGVGGELLAAGIEEVTGLHGFKEKLKAPRVILLYIPAGPAVDETVDALAAELEEGDIIADGGNSYWGDSIRRHGRMAARGIRFVDLGTSGGTDGARHGSCFMAGGSDDAVKVVEGLATRLAVPGGFVHAGPAGMGHYVKLVHNGIEFGMLQAIGEGMGFLEYYKGKIDVQGVLKCWRNGSVIRSWLIDLMEEAYRDNNGLGNIPTYIEDTGEVNWLVADALRMELPIPVIAQSVMQLFASRDEKKIWAGAIETMRHGFGGHPYGHYEPAKLERVEGRVGEIHKEPFPAGKGKKAA
jgi:6-phosphogluconate dehydrogenase